MSRDLSPPFSFDVVASAFFLVAWFELEVGVFMDIRL
jgi:hypothetical protein